MNNENENDEIMKSLNKLKNADEIFKKISVPFDYTEEERHLIIKTYLLFEKANMKNCGEDDNFLESPCDRSIKNFENNVRYESKKRGNGKY